jgi:hypothetical protein
MLSDRAIRACTERFRLATTGDARPFVLQVLLDASRSMAVGDGTKESLARELAILLLRLGERAGCRAGLCALRGRGRNRWLSAADAARVVHIPFDGSEPVWSLIEHEPLPEEPGTVRLVISDFLAANTTAAHVERAVRGVAIPWLVQLLDPWESQPTPLGTVRLRDVETDEEAELALDERAIACYRDRLTELKGRLEAACATAGGVWVSAAPSLGLEALCSEHLARRGLLRERGPS